MAYFDVLLKCIKTSLPVLPPYIKTKKKAKRSNSLLYNIRRIVI
jgi:hypothetical protein